MTEKTEALRLAAELDAEIQRTVQLDMMHHNAAAELRRLAKVEDEWAALSQDQGKLESQIDRLVAQRDALLEALKYHQEQTRPIQRTIDAIKAAEENT